MFFNLLSRIKPCDMQATFTIWQKSRSDVGIRPNYIVGLPVNDGMLVFVYIEQRANHGPHKMPTVKCYFMRSIFLQVAA